MRRAFALLCLLATSVVGQELLSVMTLTNGVISRPTNFWEVNYTNLLPFLDIPTGLTYSFSSDFRVVNGTNVFLVASNVYPLIVALQTGLNTLSNRVNDVSNSVVTASNAVQLQIVAATNTATTNVVAQITSATNTLYSSVTNWAATNVIARITSATNTVQTNVLAIMTNHVAMQTNAVSTNLLVTMTNVLSAYNSNILGGFTLSGISLTYNGGGIITNVAHGLSAAPRFLSCILVCRTNDWGYVVGDRIDITGVQSTDANRCMVVGCNDTNIFLVQYADSTIKVPNKINGSKSVELDRPSWTATIYAGQ